jgi:hypothetical protein
MAKAPVKPRPPRRRRRRSPQQPERKRSNLGRVVGATIGIAGATGLMTGLNTPVAEQPSKCGGALINRWPVKVATDQDAQQGKINLDPGSDVHSVSWMNQQVLPGAIGPGGRMEAEKRAYTVYGYLSYYKLEGGEDGDRDFHVIIADNPGDYVTGATPANGRSMVVEFPNPPCFGGKHDTLPHNSALKVQIAEARATFEDHVKDIPDNERITDPIPVTVTGVGFFDKAPKNHLPTGHSKIWPDAKGKPVVLELHPVTEIAFENDPDFD